jgi:hypothetical protein
MKHLTTLLIITTLLLLLSSSNVFGQKKCKYTYQKEDPITGEQTKGTKLLVFATPLTMQETWYLFFDRKGNNFSVRMSIKLTGEFNMPLEVGDSLTFKLADGKIFTLYAKERNAPVTEAYINGADQPVILSCFICNYDISKEQLESMATSPVTFIRMNIGSFPIDKEIGKKVGKKFQEDAHCIIQ